MSASSDPRGSRHVRHSATHLDRYPLARVQRSKRAIALFGCAALLLAIAAWALFTDSPASGASAGHIAQKASVTHVSPLFMPGTRLRLPDQAVGSVPNIRVRDSVTGRFLDSELTLRSLVRDDALRRGMVTPAGARLAPLVAGTYQLSAAAPGYRPLAIDLPVDGSRALPVTFWLQPLQPAPDAERRALRALQCGACSSVSGHVYDRDSGQPLAGLQVVSNRGDRSVTDYNGRFELLLRAAPELSTETEALPETTQINITGKGYQQQLRNVALYHDDHNLILDLSRGTAQVRDLAHVQSSGLERTRTDAAGAPFKAVLEQERLTADHAKALDPHDPAKLTLAKSLAGAQARIPVPDSIRVGTDCSGRSCTGVSVWAFEDYVGRGLDDEWIASWQSASLAAGAIAYRTYGAYYVANPVNSRYDICSSSTCQVFRPNAVSATVAAAAQTRGVLLTRDGRTAAFSEYSAENNAWDDPNDGRSCSNPDLSCGDGRNGSPSNGWPCLSDSVGRGRGCFGHGRGMSQWGTQRWAANYGRTWRWITNHYYNGNNNPGGMRNAFLANLNNDGGGQITMLDNFEQNVGRFNTAPTYSGSTSGIAASSSAQRDCGNARGGACSLRVSLQDDADSRRDWSVRLLSGVGNPAANAALARSGRIGFWVYSGGSGMRVGVGIDDSDGTERSILRAIPANSWTYVDWALSDPSQWTAWTVGSNGEITAATVHLDAIWFERAQTSYPVNLYVDEVQLVD